jgi:hypothetical protein
LSTQTLAVEDISRRETLRLAIWTIVRDDPETNIVFIEIAAVLLVLKKLDAVLRCFKEKMPIDR